MPGGIIGWSDQYYMWGKVNTPHDYKCAEKILRRALARPALDSVEDRLAGLFEQRKQARQKSKTAVKQSPKSGNSDVVENAGRNSIMGRKFFYLKYMIGGV
jgi:hypothetical protein